MTSQRGCVEKYRQPVAAKNGQWSTGSSTSSGDEDRRARSLEAEKKELRARIDAFEKKDGMQGEATIPAKEAGDSEDVWVRPRTAGDWMTRRKRCRRSDEMTDCLLFPQKCRRAPRSHCNTSCKMWRKKKE